MRRLLIFLPTCMLLLCMLFPSFGALKVDVTLSGVPDTMHDVLLNSLPLVTDEKYIKDSITRLKILYSRSLAILQTNLKPFGYYSAAVHGHLHQSQHDSWQANFDVKLNKPIIIKRIDIKLRGPGEHNRRLQRLVQHPPFKLGQRLVQTQYDSFKAKLQNIANEQGFLDAEVETSQLRINEQHHWAYIVLTFNTGPRYHFGTVIFNQTKPDFAIDFLRRFIPFKNHSPYLYNKLQELQTNLNASQYFSNVNITPAPNKKTHTVDLDIKLTSAKSQQYTVGVGYGTETRLRGLLGWQLTRIGHYGEQFLTQIQASNLYQTFTAKYIFPGKNPLTDRTILNAGQGFTQVSPYTATESIVGIEQVKQFGRWQFNYGLQEHLFQFTPSGSNKQHEHYLIPYLSMTYLNSRKYGYFDQGYSVWFSLQGALNHILSSSSFLKENLNIKRAWSLSRSTLFYTQVQAAAIQTPNFNELASPLRLYAGGIQTVRGYGYLSLSPNNQGGHYLFSVSANLEQHLFSQLSALVFYDAGNTFNRFNRFNLFQGAGIGFAWKTPVGPLQLYFSRPLAQPDQRQWRIDFSIGAFL